MDDRNFDEQSAAEWIALVESEDARIREKDIYPQIKKWIWDNDLTNVLDLGCGQGICSTLIPEGTLYTGIDPSTHLLSRADELYPGRIFLEGSAYQIPFSDGFFDGVFSVAVWQLLSDIDLATQEIARVLRPDGHFLIITADPNHIAWKSSPDRIHLHTENELDLIFKKHGLKVRALGAYRYFWFFEGKKI